METILILLSWFVTILEFHDASQSVRRGLREDKISLIRDGTSDDGRPHHGMAPETIGSLTVVLKTVSVVSGTSYMSFKTYISSSNSVVTESFIPNNPKCDISPSNCP